MKIIVTMVCCLSFKLMAAGAPQSTDPFSGSYVDRLYAEAVGADQRKDPDALVRWEKFLLVARQHDPFGQVARIQGIKSRYEALRAEKQKQSAISISSTTVKKQPSPVVVKGDTMIKPRRKEASLISIDRVLKRGDDEAARGRLDEALRLYEYAVRMDPSSAGAKRKIEDLRRQME